MPNNILFATSVPHQRHFSATSAPRQLIGCSVYHLRLCHKGTDSRDKNEIAFLILGTKNGENKR